MKFEVGQVVFFNGKSLYSKLIQVYNFINFRQTGCTHVGIITKVEEDNVLIHESVSKGFVKSYYNKAKLNKQIKNRSIFIKAPNKKLTNVYKHAEKYLGRPYAWFDILGLAFSFISGFKILKLTGANQLICSEAVSRILYDSSNKKINLSEEYSKPYDLICPIEIYLSKYFI